MRTFTCITYDVQTPRLQLRVERLEQPAAQPRVLSVDVNFLGAFLTISAIFLPPDPTVHRVASAECASAALNL